MKTFYPRSIRFPADLSRRIDALAEAERRTFSGEVLLLVESALDARAAVAFAAERQYRERLRIACEPEAA